MSGNLHGLKQTVDGVLIAKGENWWNTDMHWEKSHVLDQRNWLFKQQTLRMT